MTEEKKTPELAPKKTVAKSQTKQGALVLVLGMMLATLGGILQGHIDWVTGISSLLVELGSGRLLFGVRDLPFVNKLR